MNINSMLKTAKEPNAWDFANSILYKLCSDNPNHKNNDTILAKIWLIGRSYAAAIERRKKTEDDINDDFYIKQVVPKLKKSNLDLKIQKCIKQKNEKNALELHKYLTDLFFQLTELNKRSLASKYLHFHIPDLFYIYDSRVVGAIGLLNKELKLGNLPTEITENNDESYSIFYLKCKRIVEKIKNEYKIDLSCRQLDNLLIQIANEKLKR